MQNKRINMTEGKVVSITREDAMKRFMEAKRKKQQRVAELEERLREKYKERTGEEPKYIFSL